MNRTASVSRETKETSVKLRLDLDGSGLATISTGVGFFDHLLESFAHHSLIDLDVETEILLTRRLVRERGGRIAADGAVAQRDALRPDIRGRQ